MVLKVIGAGFGRTGTDSLREALNILGFGPTHHMFELTEGSEQRRVWREFMGGDVAHDWETLFEGYNSCVDFPAALFWRELAAANPEAKVILTVRPPESWWASASKTIFTIANLSNPESVGALSVRRAFGEGEITRENAIAAFNRNSEEVKVALPAEQLLVYELGAGWEPLCEFLGVPVPEVPYPSRNATGEFIKANLAGSE